MKSDGLSGSPTRGSARDVLAAHAAQRLPQAPSKILLLRLERVGDLVMVLEAIARVRSLAPRAQIDLVVGSWNAGLAGLIAAWIRLKRSMHHGWLAKEPGCRGPLSSRAPEAGGPSGYDLAINFEPDIRSNFLLALSGAARRVGFVSGGGGAFLSDGLEPDPSAHVSANASRSSAARKRASRSAAKGLEAVFTIPEAARRKAAELIGTHLPGEVIWHSTGSGKTHQGVGSRKVRRGRRRARTGSWRHDRRDRIGSDRRAIDAMLASWPSDVPFVQLPPELDLIVLAAVLERLRLFITGDTGPMHLAAAVGTPVLAIFGPSLPSRFAPLSPKSRIVRIDIHCSPCNLLRRPPTRCVGHVPDCLAGMTTARRMRAAERALLDGGMRLGSAPFSPQQYWPR